MNDDHHFRGSTTSIWSQMQNFRQSKTYASDLWHSFRRRESERVRDRALSQEIARTYNKWFTYVMLPYEFNRKGLTLCIYKYNAISLFAWTYAFFLIFSLEKHAKSVVLGVKI